MSCHCQMQYLEILTLGLWLLPAVSTRDPIIKPESVSSIKPESVSSRADNGRGLILRAMTKVPCYNLFIKYSKTLFFRIILIKNTNQRTNGPVNAHLISWPSKAQNIQNLENIW